MEECVFSKLENLRNEIKIIDDNIVKIIAHRINIVREIGKIKSQFGLPIKNKSVEQGNLLRLISLANEMKISSNFIHELYSLLTEIAIQVQEEDHKSCLQQSDRLAFPDKQISTMSNQFERPDQ